MQHARAVGLAEVVGAQTRRGSGPISSKSFTEPANVGGFVEPDEASLQRIGTNDVALLAFRPCPTVHGLDEAAFATSMCPRRKVRIRRPPTSGSATPPAELPDPLQTPPLAHHERTRPNSQRDRVTTFAIRRLNSQLPQQPPPPLDPHKQRWRHSSEELENFAS